LQGRVNTISRAGGTGRGRGCEDRSDSEGTWSKYKFAAGRCRIVDVLPGIYSRSSSSTGARGGVSTSGFNAAVLRY
jgi:hypothetical protein